jgi:MtN3 and saliva related transmembrane protein
MSHVFRFLLETGFFLCMVVNALLFIPQAIKLYKAKSSKDISIVTFLGFNIIQSFMIIHGYIVGDSLLMLGSFLSLITCGVVTILAFIYK